MKVLISWSGDRSAEIARILREWLPTALPDVEAWMSTHDLTKGGRWLHELARELSETNFGLVVVLPENQNSSWLNFEAGAISKWVEFANVAPILFGMQVSELEGPLAQFQATIFSREDFKRLLITVASASGTPISEARIETSLAYSWDALRSRIGAVLEKSVPLIEAAQQRGSDAGTAISLNDQQVSILAEVGKSQGNFMTESDLVKELRLNSARAQLLLGELVQAGYLSVEHVSMLGKCYRLAERGSRYLIDRGLI